MDKKIEEKLVTFLKRRSFTPSNDFRKIIAKELGCEEPDVQRIIYLMKDRNEVEFHPTAEGYVRLTHKGLESHRNKLQKTLGYLKAHWIAIVALAISIYSIFK